MWMLAALFGLLAATPASADSCTSCAAWNTPHAPFKIYGNTYYVGTAALSSILIVSDHGHILIDGDHKDSPPLILANIAALGFRIGDVKVILNTHAHGDHAGGISALQRASHAVVKASPQSAAVLKTGKPGADDPQRGTLSPFPAVANVKTIADGDVMKVGPLALTAHFTPGHSSGGTSWTWDACEGARCLHIAYLDSLTAVSKPGFKFTTTKAYPTVVAGFQKSFATVSALPCDIPISAHPEFTGFWERLTRRDKGEADALIDTAGCRRYAEAGRAMLEKRLADEHGK